MSGTHMRGSTTGKKGGIKPPDPWDPIVRISHWMIAGVVIFNGFFSGEGSTFHVWAGWIAMTVLLVRLGWGILGPKPARFSAFPPDPRAAMSHVFGLLRGDVREYPSHNPAGALMVYALWGSLVLVIATGLIMTEGKSPVTIADERAAVAQGDWSVLIEADGDGDHEDAEGFGEIAEEVHEVMSNLMLMLALLHVAGVVVEGRVLGRNLVKPMIRGTRP